ncbi:MAG: hypothetical protein ACKVOK_06365 [Flavobacteriales bacterium]
MALDSHLIQKNVIFIREGTFFPKTGVIVSYMVLIPCLIAIISGAFVAAFLLLAALFVAFARTGFDIDISKERVRNHVRIFGLKFGEWKDISGLNDMAILRSRKAYTSSNRVHSTTYHEYMFEVYILNENHLYKVHVASAPGYEKAEELAHLIAAHLPVRLTEFNPQGPSRGRRR